MARVDMYGSALAGEICLYTNRRGLYQSLLDLSVFSYVSYLCCVWGDHRSKCIHIEIYCMICMSGYIVCGYIV